MPAGKQTNDNFHAESDRRWEELDTGTSYDSPLDTLPASQTLADERFLAGVLQAQKMKELSGRPPNERYDQLNEAIRNAPTGEFTNPLNPYQAGVLALGTPPLLAYRMLEGAYRIGQTALSPLTGEKPSVDLNSNEGVAEVVLAGAGANGTPLMGKAAFGGLHIDPTIVRVGGGDIPKGPFPIEEALSKRLNEIDNKLRNHEGSYKERLALMDERKDVQSNLTLAIKERNTKLGLRGKKTMLNDEGVPKGDKLEGPIPVNDIATSDFNTLAGELKERLLQQRRDAVKGKRDVTLDARIQQLKEAIDPDGKAVKIGHNTRPYKGTREAKAERLNQVEAALKENPDLSWEDLATKILGRNDYSAVNLVRQDYYKLRNQGRDVNRTRYMKSDEGIPPEDELLGPTTKDIDTSKMFDKNLSIDRVQAEIKKIQQVMRDMGERAPTVKDIALHVYGSDEAWATRRIRDAMKKLPDTIGVDKPVFNEATTQPTALVTDNVLPFTKLPANSNKTPIEAKMSGMTEEEFRKSKGMEPVKETDYGQSDREAWANILAGLKKDIADTKAKLEEYKSSKVTKLDDINRAKVSLRLMEDRAKSYQDALDSPALTAQEMKDMIEEQTGAYSPEGLTDSQVEEVNSVLNTIYPDSRDIFKMNRYHNAGVTEEDLWHIIDTGITAGPKGLKLIEDMLLRELKADPKNARSSAMLQFLKDMNAHVVKSMEGEIPEGAMKDLTPDDN